MNFVKLRGLSLESNNDHECGRGCDKDDSSVGEVIGQQRSGARDMFFFVR